MKLSQNFTLDEFCHSQTAARLGLDNTLPNDLYPAAIKTVAMLEKVRTLLRSNAILISSGYRNKDVNKAVGSTNPNSHHTTAQAVDFTCPTYGPPGHIVSAIVKSGIEYDQIILEYGKWCHISFTDNPRKQALVIDVLGTRSWA
jgi:zinc D-Ala-D-Ala carboxypeptidase